VLPGRASAANPVTNGHGRTPPPAKHKSLAWNLRWINPVREPTGWKAGQPARRRAERPFGGPCEPLVALSANACGPDTQYQQLARLGP
jgi:hypothetical protein